MEYQGGWLWLIINVAFIAALGLALAFGMTHWKKRSRAAKEAGDRATRQMYDPQPTAERTSIVPDDPGEPFTEDDSAQAALGGPRGAPNLKPATMTSQREKKTPKPIDPGHVG